MVIWTGTVIYLMFEDIRDGSFVWTFLLLFLGIGLWGIRRSILEATLERRRSYYTLTTKRAFIAQTGKKKSLKSYPIDADTMLNFDGEDPGTILFDKEEWHDADGDTHFKDVGFKKVFDARTVYRHLRDVQTGAVE